MKITINQMLPTNDLFFVQKSNDVQRFRFVRWNRGYWLPPLEVGDKIVSEGEATLKIDKETVYSFVKVDPVTGMKDKEFFGIKKSDLEKMLEDEVLDYHSQYVYPSNH